MAKLNTIKLDSLLFYIATAAYSFSYYLGSVNATSLFGIPLSALSSALQIVALGLLFLKMIIQRNSHAKVILTLALIVICALSIKSNRAPQIIWLAILCLSVDEVPLDNIAKPFLVSSVGVVAVVISLNFLGLIPSVYMARGSHFFRNSMGFSHPNNFGQILFILFAANSILEKKDCQILGLFCALIALLVADSKTSAVGILVFAFFSRFFKSSSHLKKRSLALSLLPLLFCLISFLLPLIWNNGGKPLLYQLDSVLTNRIFYSAYYFQNYHLSLFGNSLTEIMSLPSATGNYVIETRVILDNAYCRLLIQYGLIPLAFFIAFYCFALYKTFEVFPVVFFGLLIFSVMGFVECGMIYPACNFFLVIASGALQKNHHISDDELNEEELSE